MKKKIGFFSFTCCEGCTISFIEVLNKKYDEYAKKMQIVYLRALKKTKKISLMDIAFVEGAISTKDEIKKLKEIRKNAKKLVALGSGAINGWPSNLRNNFTGKKKEEVKKLAKELGQLDEVKPIGNFVKVDGEIQGCPVEEKVFIEKLEGYLNA
jgi:sulfhydrogenase subunit delta